MFRPRHFAANHFSRHFVGTLVEVIVVTTSGAIRGGISPLVHVEDMMSRLLKDDEEILMMIVAFVEVNDAIS